MKSGIDLIAYERQEQIEKHGFTLSHDQQYNGGQLAYAAMYCLTLNTDFWPNDWSVEWQQKIIKKDYPQRLAVAGALLAAEADRVNGYVSAEVPAGPKTFEGELCSLINRYSLENGSNTPDFILGLYLTQCLVSWNQAVKAREQWYGRGNEFPSGAIMADRRDEPNAKGGELDTSILRP